MFRNQFLWIGLLLFLEVVPVNAAESVVLLNDAADFQSAVAQLEQQNWTELKGTILVEQEVTWVYLDLSQSDFAILHLGDPYLLSYKLISPSSGEEFYHGGLLAENESRVIFHPEYLLPLSSTWGDKLLLRIEARQGFAIPIEFLTTNQVSRLIAIRFMGDGMYYGALTLAIIFAVCVALFNRYAHAGRLAVTLLMWLSTAVTVSGYGNLLLWPNNPALIFTALPVVICLAGISSAWFSWHFLRWNSDENLYLKGIKFFFWVNIVSLIAVVSTDIFDSLVRLNLVGLSIFIMCAAIANTIRGDLTSKYFVVAAVFIAMPAALLPTIPSIHNYSSVTGTLCLFSIMIAVMRRLAERTRGQEIESKVVSSRAQFLAAMSHEIRTPLNGIIGFSELCANEPIKGQVRTYIAQIQRSAKLLLNVVNEVLDYSKLEADAVEVELAPMSVRETLEDIIKSLGPSLKSGEVEIRVEVADDVASSVMTDPIRCGQILMNLLSNAIKFAQGGKVSVRVFLEFGCLKFEIKDNGIGIPAAALDSVFDPYKQATEQTTRLFGGTGLGLSIAKQFAELIGGTIKLESELGVGSVFTLQIPYEEAVSEEETKQDMAPLNFKGINVLVVEDNSVNQLLAKTILIGEGMLVDQASNGRLAIDKASSNHYDLIFMDVQMPELNGIEATAALREGGCSIPIIALTASNSVSDQRACLEVGMSDFLSKPFLRQDLLDKVERWGMSTASSQLH